MATELLLTPSAASLSASLRDIGYSLETAVADIIDNSISAGATRVQVMCDLATETPSLAIIDDGHGMTSTEIVAAMRHGSTNPKIARDPEDLGRFGLGLKTASFSQCRTLTVVSRRKKDLSAAEWNLDLVEQRNDWVIRILDHTEIDNLPFAELLIGPGTVVVWRDLDRLFEDETGKRRAEVVNEKLDQLDRHLSLVFHRYLSGKVRGKKRFSISVNGHELDSFDPFCTENTATQVLPEEKVKVDGILVRMQPYILPHHSRLTAAEYDYYKDRSDFLSNQGVYVYRNSRLLAWGDWFRITPKGEATKLARVQIDFPNSLDEAWTIDIKKSRARPPYAVRERLKQIILKIIDRSHAVHRNRGRRLFNDTKSPIWERFAETNRVRYEINTTHPILESLREVVGDDAYSEIELLCEAISSSLPIQMIYSDYSTSPKDIGQSDLAPDQIDEKLQALKHAVYVEGKTTPEQFRDVAQSTRMFDAHADALEEFIKREL